MTRPVIVLYVDTVSPFAYEAYYILRHDPVFKACDIKYVPIFLGGVMKACGNTPPIDIKNKDKWINVERLRWAKAFAIPMVEVSPEGFPPLTLQVMRCLCALTVVDPDPEKLRRALDVLFHAYWVDATHVEKADVLLPVLKGALGETLADKVMSVAGKEGKAVLAKNTNQALAAGAFGLPWFQCTNANGTTESFWGVDHIGQVCNFLGLEKPAQGGWKAML